MSKLLRPLRMAAAVLVVAVVIGCDNRPAQNDPATAPTAGERVDRALERTGEALSRGADRAGDVLAPAVDDAVDRTRQAGQQIRAGARELAADVAGGVHHVLADITEAAVTRGGIDDLVDRLSEADQSRIGDARERTFGQLDAEIDRFRELWRSRYGRDFDIDDPNAVFNFVTIQGDPDHAERATVVFPARDGMSALSVPMVREGTAWRVDVPDTLTPQQIADNLASGLRPLNAGNPPLPDDIIEGYRTSAHGTMAALLGQSRTPQQQGP